ncbi:MAG: T9SS type A sorting domain-containing protein [Flavobacteriales bacterium]|nr:T9SS type A sorting domain-containing protein [Flavobacteriales bacterium]
MKMILPTYNEKKRTGFRLRLCDMAARPLLIAVLPFLSWSWATAQTSVYHPFPGTNSSWCILTGCLDGSCNGDYGYIIDQITGDTIIDGLIYQKVQETYYPVSNNGCCTPPIGLSSGYLRDDTANKKAYWRGETMGQDTLLYDFTLQVGDTLNGFMGNCMIPWIVQSIDSAIVGTNYHKRINLESDTCNGFSIIEGIGSTQGLTNCPYLPFEMATILQCVTVSDTLLYTMSCGSGINPCADLPSYISPIFSQRLLRVQVSPNPTTGMLILDGQTDQLPLALTIMDLTGKVITHKVITYLPATVDVSTSSKGVYSLRIIQRDGVVSYGKFIRQ